jgi:hypothetical protein
MIFDNIRRRRKPGSENADSPLSLQGVDVEAPPVQEIVSEINQALGDNAGSSDSGTGEVDTEDVLDAVDRALAKAEQLAQKLPKKNSCGC